MIPIKELRQTDAEEVARQTVRPEESKAKRTSGRSRLDADAGPHVEVGAFLQERGQAGRAGNEGSDDRCPASAPVPGTALEAVMTGAGTSTLVTATSFPSPPV